MPTRRGYRRRGSSTKKKELPEGVKRAGRAVKKGATKVVKGYLKGTQKMADKIEEKLPATTYDRSGRGSRGRGGRGRRGRGSR